MNRLGLIFATGLLLACWTASVSSRSLDVVSESETSQNDDLSALNIPSVLEFEGGEGDEVDGARDKRTPRFIFRTVSCLFTFLINPSCLQGITGGAGGGGGSSSGGSLSSYGANRRQQSQPYYMISLPRYNDTDSNGTATEYPIYPIENTSEYPNDDPPPRPTNPFMQLLQWKMNLIPNLLRRFFPGFGGGRRDDGGSGGGGLFGGLGGGSGGGGLFGGLGGGRGLLSLLGGRQGGGGGLGGLGGLGGFGGGAGQY